MFVGSFNFDPLSMRLDTQNGELIRSPELATQAAWLFTLGTSPSYPYRVTLLGDDDLVWITEDDGREVRYYQEPLESFLVKPPARPFLAGPGIDAVSRSRSRDDRRSRRAGRRFFHFA